MATRNGAVPEPKTEVLSREQGLRRIDRQARRSLGIPGAEFLRRFEASREERSELLGRFFRAVQGGDLDGLIEVLAEDVVAVGDGGGRGAAVKEPVRGGVQVARFLLGLARRFPDVTIVPAEVNGEPGAITYYGDATVGNVFAFEVTDGRIAMILSVANPDKLSRVPPLEA